MKKKIIIIDDEKYYRDGLMDFLSPYAEVLTFKHPDEFGEKYQTPASLRGVSLVVLDYCFDTFDALDKDLVAYIRLDLSFKKHLVLWSLEDHIPCDYRDFFDAVLPKQLMTLPEIERCIESSK
ncbi:MAG: hypothetical protein AB8G05_21860 [Oligoflexales bacterium]